MKIEEGDYIILSKKLCDKYKIEYTGEKVLARSIYVEEYNGLYYVDKYEMGVRLYDKGNILFKEMIDSCELECAGCELIKGNKESYEEFLRQEKVEEEAWDEVIENFELESYKEQMEIDKFE